MARPRKYTNEQIIAALKKKCGMVYHAADLLGCDADTIYNRAKTVAAVKRALTHETGKVDDEAEMRLMKAIKKGQGWAIMFRLGRKAKDRGYGEKTEIKHTGIPAWDQLMRGLSDDTQEGSDAAGPTT